MLLQKIAFETDRIGADGGIMTNKADRIHATLEALVLSRAEDFQRNPTKEALDAWADAQEVRNIALELLYPPVDPA
jgi:hypothetical protein